MNTTCTRPVHQQSTIFTSASAAGVLNRALVAALDGVMTWRERARQRAALAALDDRMLADIGVTRAQALYEADKPFWSV